MNVQVQVIQDETMEMTMMTMTKLMIMMRTNDDNNDDDGGGENDDDDVDEIQQFDLHDNREGNTKGTIISWFP